jgi:hypothetical protein
MSNVIPLDVVNDNLSEVISHKVKRYVDDYVMNYNKCADAILSLAETCFKAKEELNKNEFKQFAKAVRLDGSDATLSKYIKIGKQSVRFRKIEDRLPSAWTVLYNLACLKGDEYTKVLPIISNDMTAKDIRIALGKPSNSIPLSVPDMTINLSQKGSARKRKIYFDLEELAVKYNFKIIISKEFESEVMNCDIKEVA